LTERLREVFVWPSENQRFGASDHQKKKPQKKMGIARPRPDGGVKKTGIARPHPDGKVKIACSPSPARVRLCNG